ncbi:uncharacterized protein LOC131165063 isoform X2 [Malania oleifera]|uniref:uncharacterized protein LOC131165063 isoform X1 n=1 Tax=Malania oleifera TaxID=397392 RepID=UPI0025AEC51E|nr:uncharacterized protein LOC131165063 isoform X1 [Malania oleifera]XP_057978704.1 uncharacterized protein LOC131165063 isoform X2 [Malania oleifera]
MKGVRSRAHGTTTEMLVVVVVVVAAAAVWNAGGAAAGGLTARQCKAERDALIGACMPAVARKPPSTFCCLRIRVSHTECVCPEITPKVVSLIDINYAIKVVRGCGRPVPRHFKCGSITTP